MKEKIHDNMGTVLEEVLRAYFLRAGFFVIRSVPFRFGDEDLTDVDLWLYERPTGTARRVQICDIKYKQRPKAVERLFWTSGLADALGVDGAYVATTDRRPSLHAVARNLDIQLIDGADLKRIQGSQSVLFPDRIADEQLNDVLKVVDKEFRNKDLQEAKFDILLSLSDGFGAPSAVRALGSFCQLAKKVTEYQPNSNAAMAAGRLAYLASAILCESLDYVSVEAAFRSVEERRELILQAVRYGALSREDGQQALKLALALIEKYATGGKAVARMAEQNLKNDLDAIPAEIVADQAVKLLKGDQLFLTGREFELACYLKVVPPFDLLAPNSKAMLGALLDYAGVDRRRFAEAWSGEAPMAKREGVNLEGVPESNSQGQFGLFAVSPERK